MTVTAKGRVVKTLVGAVRPEAPVLPQQPQAKIKQTLPASALHQSHAFRLNP